MGIDKYRIIQILYDCISDEKDPEKTIEVSGIGLKYNLDRNKLDEYKDEVNILLNDIIGENANITFDQLRFNKDGKIWGNFYDAEVLFILCRGMGLLECTNRNYSGKNPYLPYITRPKKDPALRFFKIVNK